MKNFALAALATLAFGTAAMAQTSVSESSSTTSNAAGTATHSASSVRSADALGTHAAKTEHSTVSSPAGSAEKTTSVESHNTPVGSSTHKESTTTVTP
ncbi:MAG TPA: hypothetical protein V6C76_13145 [Drouetiella sp.]